MSRAWMLLPAALVALAFACGKDDAKTVRSVPAGALPGHDTLNEDTSPKQGPRLVAPEELVRTYLQLFGGLAPLDVQAQLQKQDGSIFDTWDDYLAALGLPDYTQDIPRGTQPNSLMVATFERIGVALCDRAVLRDLGPTKPEGGRAVFDFDLPSGDVDAAAFAPRFDVLHRTFLGYPAKLAPANRADRFFKLYASTAQQHKTSKLSAAQAGWAAVCYGLVRHPEFHLY